MSRTPGPVQPLPAGVAAVSFEDLRGATACPDCASEPRFVPIRFPGNEATVFGIYVAHDHTCPLLAHAEEC